MKRVEAYQFLLKTLIDVGHAKALLCGILKISREDYIRDPDQVIENEEMVKIQEAALRLNKSEPLSKIIGQREFWGREFKVTKDTLDPRPETEILIEHVLELFPKNKNYHFLELGVGTGCVIMSLLKEYTQSQGVGIDISLQALAVANDNLKQYDLGERLELVHSSWFQNVTGKYDLIVSNPPYIDKKDIENLDICVRDYDPHLALDGGVDGLECYLNIARNAQSFLKTQGVIMMEIGAGQEKDVIKIFTDQGFRFLKKKEDLSGITRVLSFIGEP